MSYIFLPPAGSIYYSDPVTTLAALPATDTAYTIRLVQDTGIVYYFNGAAWLPINSLLAPGAVADTNSVDLTVTAGVLTADLRLSANAATAGSQIVALNIEAAGSVGLRAQILDSQIRGLISGSAPVSYVSATGVISMAAATAAVDGYLTAANFVTFNSKEPAIAAGTTAQYWRGDKSFQTLNVAAMTAVTDGSAAAAGAIGEILSASQAANTATGVGATGTYGSPVSVSLTAGVWEVQGVAGFNENGATLTTAIECGISASATGVGISEFDTSLAPFLISSTSDAIIATPVVNVNISGTTTYYLNTRFYYTSGGPQHRGRITARRVR